MFIPHLVESRCVLACKWPFLGLHVIVQHDVFFRVKPHPLSVNLFILSAPSHEGRIYLNTQATAPPSVCSGKVNPGDVGI